MDETINHAKTTINVHTLSEQLGIPVVPTVVLKKEGILKLTDSVMELCKEKRILNPVSVVFEDSIEQNITELERMVEDSNYPCRWLAIKLLEGDAEVRQMLKNTGKAGAVEMAGTFIKRAGLSRKS